MSYLGSDWIIDGGRSRQPMVVSDVEKLPCATPSHPLGTSARRSEQKQSKILETQRTKLGMRRNGQERDTEGFRVATK